MWLVGRSTLYALFTTTGFTASDWLWQAPTGRGGASSRGAGLPSARWQDDDNLRQDALGLLAQRRTAGSSEPPIESDTAFAEGTDAGRQLHVSRQMYFRESMGLLMSSYVGRREAIALWLSGVAQHNQSLLFLKNIDPQEATLYQAEIDAIENTLQATLEHVPEVEVRDQLRQWIAIPPPQHDIDACAYSYATSVTAAVAAR